MGNINNQTVLKFEEVYLNYYSKMKRFALEYVLREEDAENIVQDIFLELWESKQLILSHSNIFSLLFTTVKNRCIDFLRHQQVKQKSTIKLQNNYQNTLQLKLHSLELFDEDIFKNQDIERIIEDAIGSLPERCRQIFVKNKIKGEKQKAIAQELNISVHTDETQMGIAYKKLRESLKEYLPLLIFLLG